ncbi:MAG: hypothetical protein QXM06_07215 [Archaeoglobaceae archaeon]
MVRSIAVRKKDLDPSILVSYFKEVVHLILFKLIEVFGLKDFKSEKYLSLGIP